MGTDKTQNFTLIPNPKTKIRKGAQIKSFFFTNWQKRVFRDKHFVCVFPIIFSLDLESALNAAFFDDLCAPVYMDLLFLIPRVSHNTEYVFECLNLKTSAKNIDFSFKN